jgi:hypothetical protein
MTKNEEKWKRDIDAKWEAFRENKSSSVVPKEIFDARLVAVLQDLWEEQSQVCRTPIDWSGILVRFAGTNPANIMQEFAHFYPSYEGDLGSFIRREWGFPIDDTLSEPNHDEFVLYEWRRQNVDLLKQYGMSPQDLYTDLQNRNEYIWRAIRGDCFEDLAYSLERLSLVFAALVSASTQVGSDSLLKFVD